MPLRDVKYTYAKFVLEVKHLAVEAGGDRVQGARGVRDEVQGTGEGENEVRGAEHISRPSLLSRFLPSLFNIAFRAMDHLKLDQIYI